MSNQRIIGLACQLAMRRNIRVLTRCRPLSDARRAAQEEASRPPYAEHASRPPRIHRAAQRRAGKRGPLPSAHDNAEVSPPQRRRSRRGVTRRRAAHPTVPAHVGAKHGCTGEGGPASCPHEWRQESLRESDPGLHGRLPGPLMDPWAEVASYHAGAERGMETEGRRVGGKDGRGKEGRRDGEEGRGYVGGKGAKGRREGWMAGKRERERTSGSSFISMRDYVTRQLGAAGSDS
jgi:hypothetical protein